MMDYQEAWDLQETLLARMVKWKSDLRNGLERPAPAHSLLFCQHPHVYTLGKSGSEDNLLIDTGALKAYDATFVKINRGGDITYHGPGQLVGYPILDLERIFTDIHRYMRGLEEAIIRCLAEYGIVAGRVEGLTGVWLDGNDGSKARKICALGVKTSRWVTMHGFAFNIHPDLSYFGHIIPCGITDKKVTSMQQELGYVPDMDEVRERVEHHLLEVFGLTSLKKDKEEFITGLKLHETS